MIKIYHFCEDEKFINSAYEQFEDLYPEQNHFFIYDLKESLPKHIRVTSHFTIIDDLKGTIESLPQPSITIFHSLPQKIIEHLKFLPTETLTIGLFFGFEVYNDPSIYSENKALSKITKFHFANRSLTLKKKVKEKIWPLYRLIKKDLYLTPREQKINALKRLNFFGASFKEEHEMIQKLVGIRRPMFKFWYYPLEKILTIDTPININKSKIMIGNSGFKANNHLDIFSRLNKLNIKDQHPFSPVSYGNPLYINEIKKSSLAQRLKIEFIEDFMTLQDYQALLDNVKIAIFNTRRQQAIGNIIALIYSGAKVFISERNTFYHFLKGNLLQVYSYEKDLTQQQFETSLTQHEIEHNRQILADILNSSILKKNLQVSMEQIFTSLKKS